MKDDMISRQAALDALGEEPPVWYDGEDEIAERNQWRRDVAAIKALPSATDTNVATTDTISRQAAQDFISTMNACNDISDEAYQELIVYFENLPSTQPDVPDTNVGDMISRQAAIETVRKAKSIGQAHRMLIQLPPAQPDIETLLKLAVAMTKPIEYLNLSVRSYNALKRRGVDSVAKVYELKQKENLKKIRNIGAKSADEIEDCLNVYLAQWEEGQDDG